MGRGARRAAPDPPRVRQRSAHGPAPGIGDRVLVRTDRNEADDSAPYSGRVIKLLERARAADARHLPRAAQRRRQARAGRQEAAKAAKSRSRPAPRAGAEDGDLVSRRSDEKPRATACRRARVRERLGSIKSEQRHQPDRDPRPRHPRHFPRTTRSPRPRPRSPPRSRGREDWRALPLVTIDPPDAKDHDDAVHAEPDPDPANPGGSRSSSPSPTSRIMCGPARRSTARRWSAATRSISPTASCRCCPSASPTISARCAERGPPCARRAHDLRRRRQKAPPLASIA